MTLFLTSAGFTNKAISDIFLAELTKPVEQSRVLMVAYAQNSQEEYYINESKKELLRLGLKDIVIANIDRPIDISTLGQFDIVYVCGGNTFAILKKLRETGLINYIIDQVTKGTIYVGVSAGSIIACADIEIAGWGSEGDKNEVGLKDLKALNFTDISIFPHFKETLRSEVEQYRQKTGRPVFELTDEGALFIKGDQVKKI